MASQPDAHSALARPSGIRTERHERSIPVPLFADSARKASPDQRDTHDVGEYAPEIDLSAEQEGAHGELLLWRQPTNEEDAV
jgi:hypothetical protein